MRVPRGSAKAAGWCEHYKEHRMLLGISPELFFLGGGGTQKKRGATCSLAQCRACDGMDASPRGERWKKRRRGVFSGEAILFQGWFSRGGFSGFFREGWFFRGVFSLGGKSA